MKAKRIPKIITRVSLQGVESVWSPAAYSGTRKSSDFGRG